MSKVIARRFNENDNVAVILSPVTHDGDTVVVMDETGQNQIDELTISFKGEVPDGHALQFHKIALTRIKRRNTVTKLGGLVGFATKTIHKGDWVHCHNVGVGDRKITPRMATSTAVDPVAADIGSRTFNAIVREDGRIATRNCIGISNTVLCSGDTSDIVVEEVMRRVDLSRFPNIDGFAPMLHKHGCGVDAVNRDLLYKTIRGHQHHPNNALSVTLGLGCETCSTDGLVQLQLPGSRPLGPDPNRNLVANMQEDDIEAFVNRVVGWIEERLPMVNNVTRKPMPLKHLKVLLKCGGSSAASALTANPALGYAVDLLVSHGATVILCETTECYGAEDQLTHRAVSVDVAEQFMGRIGWWEQHATKMAGSTAAIDGNPSKGNKQGGLSTIFEKSLGAVGKSGTCRMRRVYNPCDEIGEDGGFVFMDTPGFDAGAMTCGAAGGAIVCVFTTGRGTLINHLLMPTIKVGADNGLFERLPSYIDINAGVILNGASVESVGRLIFEEIIAVAGGKLVKAENININGRIYRAGRNTFAPFQPGLSL